MLTIFRSATDLAKSWPKSDFALRMEHSFVHLTWLWTSKKALRSTAQSHWKLFDGTGITNLDETLKSMDHDEIAPKLWRTQKKLVF